jgi:hypothetical protein
LARNNYKSEKRKKDLERQKAQEEKRLRRFKKNKPPETEAPDSAPEQAVTDRPAKAQE